MDFETACDIVRAEMFSATDAEKLKLYALYRIANHLGEVKGNDMVACAKKEAVRVNGHLSSIEAANEYVRIVDAKLMSATM